MTTTDLGPLRPLPRNTVVAVAGISHCQSVARDVQIGDEVVLRHDRSNPFDQNAVSIHTVSGDLVGHVPAGDARLNERLLVGHPGGVWGGVVVDRYDGETIGLRVKILTLLGHRDPRFGSDHHGLRDTPDDVTVPDADTPDAGQAADARPAPDQVLVHAKASGRLLGTYLETTGSRVRVRDTSGRLAAYPAAVVTVTGVLPASA